MVEFVLTPDQLFVLTWVSQGIVQLLKIIANLAKRPIPDNYKLGLVFVVSGLLGYFWAPVEWPPLSDPVAFFATLFTNIGIVMAAAAVVYSHLSGPVLGWIDAKVVSRIPVLKKLPALLKP